MINKFWLIFISMIPVIISDAAAVQQVEIDGQKDNISLASKDTSDATTARNETILMLAGFGSLGAINSNQTHGDYVLDSFMPNGAGRSTDLDLNNYSKFAVQASALFSPKVSGQLQVITAYNADGSFQPDVEWYNIKYILNNELAVRVGRVELPTFLDSGNHDVGYSYAWAHLPIEMYHLLSIQTSDGIDATYRSKIGDSSNSLKLLFGQNTSDRPTSLSTSKDMLGIFDKFEYNQIIFNLSLQKRNTSYQNKLTGLNSGWYESSDLSVGVNYDPGNWFLISEWIQSHTRYNSAAMYVSAGYRINKFTPFIVHGQNNAGSFPAGSTPSISSVARADRSQKTDSVGVRWDFMKNYDLKFQYDQVTLSDQSNGFLANVPTNVLLYGDTFYAVSAVVDFVF